MDTKSLDHTASAVTAEILDNFDFPTESIGMIKDVIMKHFTPLIKAPVHVQVHEHRQSKKKKSHHSNYYAFFHSCCSLNNKGYGHLTHEYVFKYQPDPEQLKKLKKPEKQQKLYDLLHDDENAEQLARFFAFESKGDLHEVVKFVEHNLDKIEQMDRTSLIWNQFLSADDRAHWIDWYRNTNQIIKIEPPETLPVKVTARLRQPSPPTPTPTQQTPQQPTQTPTEEDDIYNKTTDDEADDAEVTEADPPAVVKTKRKFAAKTKVRA